MRGVIFASGLGRDVFTAGNDIKELYAPQTSRSRRARSAHFPAFRRVQQQTLASHNPACLPSSDNGYSHERKGMTWLWADIMGRYREFWVTSNVFLARLYRTPLVTVAAIKGACPAGGCCLAMCCDLRIMTQQARCTPQLPAVMSSLLGAALRLHKG